MPRSARNSSLEQIEGDRWEDPPADTTRLIRECHRLRRIPLSQLTAEDLRLLIGQGIGTATLTPIALELLTLDPLLEGDFYPGDLLVAVLRLPQTYWLSNPDALEKARSIVSTLAAPDGALAAALKGFEECSAGL